MIGPGSAARLISKLIRWGHGAMLEHASASFHIVCDRGVSHELVRHRLASYAQESTRYCRADHMGGGHVEFIAPVTASAFEFEEWRLACAAAESQYIRMIEAGAKPEVARDVLPISVRTSLVMTANMREWLHVLALRTSKRAHPKMRQIAEIIESALIAACPEVFSPE